MALLGTGPDDEAVDPRGYHAMRSIDMISGRSFERDAVLHHIDDLPPGLHEITYGVRATTAGTFLVAPAQIEALYDATFLGRSAMQTVVVRP
jgi:uncharacterized protein YfaS (alpha-2-macroglobulin family)